MSARAAGLAVALLITALVLLALQSAQRSPSSPSRTLPAPAVANPPLPAPPADPVASRDIFQYADEPGPEAHAMSSERETGVLEPEAPPAPDGPRLVGVLRRGGRLVAALAVDGDVVLVAPGQSAAGAIVLSVDEESVRVRLADGSERTLAPSE